MGRKCLCFCDLLAATQIVLKADLFLPHFKMGMIHLLQPLSLPRASNVQMFSKTFWQPLQQQSFSIVNPDGASINKRSQIHLDQDWQLFRFPICNLLPSLAQLLPTPPATLLQSQLHICNQGNQDHCSLWCRQFCCIYIYAINTSVQSWKEFSASQFSRLYITALPGCCPLPWRGVRWGASVSVGVVLFLGVALVLQPTERLHDYDLQSRQALSSAHCELHNKHCRALHSRLSQLQLYCSSIFSNGVCQSCLF